MHGQNEKQAIRRIQVSFASLSSRVKITVNRSNSFLGFPFSFDVVLIKCVCVCVYTYIYTYILTSLKDHNGLSGTLNVDLLMRETKENKEKCKHILTCL